MPRLSSYRLLAHNLLASPSYFSKQFKNRRASSALIIFVLIILIAAYLRLASLNLAEFKSDEAGTSFVLKALVQQGKFPLVGPPLSTGGNAGPIYYYMLAIPFLISSNPIVASTFIAILNIVGVILTFKFAREFFNERIALIATALDAVSPFAVLFSRKIWNPDLIFPFTVILFYCLYSFVIKNKPRYLIPLFVAFAIILQIHPVTLFLAPVILLFLWKSRSQIQSKYLLIGIALSLILFLPFIYGETTSNFSETGSLASTLRDFTFGNVNLNLISLISSDTSGSGFEYVLGSSATSFYSSIFNANSYFVVESLCLYLGFALVLVRAARNPFGENLRYSMLLLWVAIPAAILLFFNPALGLWPHHAVMFFPANFLMVAVAFDFAMTRKTSPMTIFGKRFRDWPRITRISAKVILLSILLAQLTFGIGFLGFLDSHGGTGGDYGVGLQHEMDVAGYIAQNSNGSSFTISSNLTPGQIGREYDYLLSLYNKTPSSSANLSYVVIDTLSGASPSLLQELSRYSKVDFGPLTVYVITS
jgi:Dolichyl-phosphate-mannose-protein mannosyltransferase